MLRKFFLLFIAISLVTAQAQASSGISLKQAFDDFTYATTVEWDQKDKAFYQRAADKLKEAVVAAQQTGMTNGQILDEISQQTTNEMLKSELQAIRLKVELGLLSASDIQAEVQAAMAKSAQRGASWNGEVVLLGLLGVVFVALLVGYVACVTDPNSVTVCSDYTYCDSSYGCEVGTSCGCSRR